MSYWVSKVKLGQKGSNKDNFGGIESKRSYWCKRVRIDTIGANYVNTVKIGQIGSKWVTFDHIVSYRQKLDQIG